MSHREWWAGLTPWLKVLYLFVAIPAWFLMILCIATGHEKSLAALAAFIVFAGVAVSNIIFDRRHGRPRHESGGIDFGGDDA